MKNLVFKDDQFEFQLLRLLGESTSGAADIGEVICTAQRIKEGDFKSWCDEWSKTARKLHDIANDCYSKGHMVSARKAYLRASNYYRTAEFYLHDNQNDPKIEELYNLSLECFSYVMKLNSPSIKAVKIPYENTTLPGHYYRLETSIGPKPVLVAINGFDGTKEELYALAMAALEHGMDCLTFEGPGQGEVIRNQKLFFRYDYEKVITPVVDFLLSREETDPKKIVLNGDSLGGYLAPRAAAFEHRLAACIANGGLYDFLGGITKKMGVTREALLESVRIYPEETNKKVYALGKADSLSKWFFSHGMYVTGVDDPSEFFLKMGDYYLNEVAAKIQCPTLIIDGANDEVMGGQAEPLYDALTCKKDYLLFESEFGAGSHCQIGAKLFGNESILTWVDTILKNI